MMIMWGRKVFVVTVALFLCFVLPGIIFAESRNSDENSEVRAFASTSKDGYTGNNRPYHNTHLGEQKSENSDGVETSTDTWKIETPDESTGSVNYYLSSRSMAIDSGNAPHVVYGGRHLYYAWRDGSQWHYETVDASPNVGGYASIALDTSGKAHISYYDESVGNLRYATNASGSWATATVDSGYSGGVFNSIALDAAGNVHISYNSVITNSGNNGDLKYATDAESLAVSTFKINNGAAKTKSRTVTNNTVTGSPTHYKASESPTFKNATWKAYTGAPKFTLSSSKGVKTVYFKVKNANGESSVVSDTITLKKR